MATGTETPTSQATPPPEGVRQPHEVAIDRRLRLTKRQVRMADLTVALLAMTAGSLVYLFLATLLDHWVVDGGFSIRGRLLLFAGLLGCLGMFSVRQLLPLLTRPISEVYAAQTLEQCRPSMKTSLVNLLFLRREQDTSTSALDRSVMEGLRRTTAAELGQIPKEMVVDHKYVIRLGALLAIVIAVLAFYLVLSPKNLLPSFGRVLLPWADIPVPTRVTIDDVKPGDEVLRQGDSIVVSAVIDGAGHDETAYVYYTTSDRQSINQAIPMTLSERGFRHQATLPPGQLGLQQNLRYHLVAGDCQTRQFHVQVLPALTILVDSVHYDYPDYTGIADRTVPYTGDIRGIEGTRVTIAATSNVPIRTATVELDCDPTRARRMTVDGTSATGQFVLRIDPDDKTEPEFDSYQLRFRDADGEENREPIRHTIEVTGDLPPEVRLLDPPPARVEVPIGGQLTLTVQAEDPDFALSRVIAHAEREGGDLGLPLPFEGPHPGVFESDVVLRPAELGLAVGDEVVYWFEAVDNKHPEANRAETEQRWIVIVPNESSAASRPSDAEGDAPSQPDAGQPDQAMPEQDPEQEPGEQDDAASEDATEPGEGDAEGGGQAGGGSEGEASESDEPQDGQGKSAAGDSDSEDSPQGDSPSQGTSPSDDEASSGEQPSEGGSSDSPDETNTAEQKPAAEGGSQQQGGPAEPLDGETNPGDVFEEVLDQMKQDQQPADTEGTERSPESSDTESPSADGTTGAESDDTDEAANDGPSSEPEPGREDEGIGESAEPSQTPESPGDTRSAEDERGPGNEAGNAPNESGGGESADSGDPQPEPEGGQMPDEPKGPTAGQESEADTAEPQEPDERQQEAHRDDGGSQAGAPEKAQAEDSDQPGAGNDGGNTETESGSGSANSQGAGETGSQGGDDTPTDQSTGESGGQESGSGTAGQGTEEPSDRESDESSDTDSPSGRQPDGNRPDSPPNEESDSEQTPSEGTGETGQGGSRPAASSGSAQDEPTVEESGSEANLEYANEATDLALEYLEDQLGREEPNPELLDRLGWNKDELQQFVDQWKQLKQNAERDRRGGQQELNEALKSLGLRRDGATLRQSDATSDQGNVTEALRFQPPPGWEERFRAYNRGTSRADR